MRKTIYQLAYRNLKKYKKHYFIVSFIVLLASLFFVSYVITWENHYAVEKIYNQKTYGTWYLWVSMEPEEKQKIEDILMNKGYYPKYGYYYDLGTDENGYKMARLDEELFEMCHLILKEGHYPKNDNEIMISSSMIDKTYCLNQEVVLAIDGLGLGRYKIVGIIENSQDVFPDIYTNIGISDNIQMIANGVIGKKEIDGHYHLYETPEEEYLGIGYTLNTVYENEFGYDANRYISYVNFSTDQIIILTEVFLLIAFVMSMLTSSSLKKRNQEFALLRGIGMTTRQLFAMVFYENLWTTFIAVIFGFFGALGISYCLMLYFQIIYHEFIFQIHFVKTTSYLLLLLGLVLISSLYPIYSSSKQALSGAFGGRTFQYIQVRYHVLKVQTKWRLAYRELFVTKRLTFALVFFTCLLIIPFSTLYFKNSSAEELQKKEFESLHYVNVENIELDEQDIQDIQSLYHQTSHVYRLGYFEDIGCFDNKIFNSVSLLAIDDLEIFNHCVIEGRVPKNNHEVLIGINSNLYKNSWIDEYNMESHQVDVLQIGDIFSLNQQEYEVVGRMKTNETVQFDHQAISVSYTNDASIIMIGEEFDKYCRNYSQNLKFYTGSLKESETLAKQLKMDKKFKDAIITLSDGYLHNIKDINENDQVYTNPLMYIFPIMTSLVICYFINKNYIMNNFSDYALYRLIGMTKNDLLLKQFFKAVIMSLYIFIIEMLWIVITGLENLDMMSLYSYTGISMLLTFVFYIIIYCMPLYTLMKEDMVSYLYGNE